MRLRRGRKATADQPGWQGPGAADRFERAQNWLDERLGTTSFARRALRKVFPDHWSFLLGEIALGCLVVLVVTGVFLIFFYTPDPRTVIYDGPYAPLKGDASLIPVATNRPDQRPSIGAHAGPSAGDRPVRHPSTTRAMPSR